jgi:hypothetical protein
MTNRRPQLIRLTGSCLAMLASVFFCHRFSGFQYDSLVLGGGTDPRSLPAICHWFVRYSQIAIAVPIIILWAGAVRLVRRSSEDALVEALAQLALIAALLLLIFCILAWQIPYLVDVGTRV